MKVLLVGGGGREHAIGWALARSSRVDEIYSLPGNPGLAELGPTIEGISPTDAGAVAAMARIQGIDLVVVGPEGPLAAGVVDALSRLGIPVFGPTRSAARLESSKSFAKEVMRRAGVPTAGAAAFDAPAEAKAHLAEGEGPYVVKADGLAAGKGVLVTDSLAEASAWVDHCFEGGFGAAGNSVVIEEHLDGEELSVFVVCTDRGAVPLQPARDYKRLLDGDRGPNTGGMGSYSPVAGVEPDLVPDVMTGIVEPTLSVMTEDANPFYGFLYAGLALTSEGPKVIEFNVRLGDPEAQAILPLLATDFVDLLEGAAPEWSDRAAVNVVIAAQGYPEAPAPGAVIGGLGALGEDVLIFHAGTRRDGKRLVAAGGRVLDLVGTGPTLADARAAAYAAVEAVAWPGAVYRTDIAG